MKCGIASSHLKSHCHLPTSGSSSPERRSGNGAWAVVIGVWLLRSGVRGDQRLTDRRPAPVRLAVPGHTGLPPLRRPGARGKLGRTDRGDEMPRTTTSSQTTPRVPGRLGRLAHFTTRYRWPVIAAWVALTIFGGVAA